MHVVQKYFLAPLNLDNNMHSRCIRGGFSEKNPDCSGFIGDYATQVCDMW